VTTLLERFRDMEARLAAKFGTLATLRQPANVYSTDGTVSGTPVTEAVIVDGPADDSHRYAATGADSRVSATFYLPAKSLTLEPALGFELVVNGRTWVVYDLTANYVQGGVTGYRLDCGEVGASG